MVKSHRILGEKDRKALHTLLLASKAPGVIRNFDKWNESMTPAFYYGVFFDKKLGAVVELKFDQNEPHGLNFGAVCHPKFTSRWATKKVFRDVFAVAFSHFKKDYLFAETRNVTAEKSLQTLGFIKLYQKPCGFTYYVLNKDQILPLLRAA